MAVYDEQPEPGGGFLDPNDGIPGAPVAPPVQAPPQRRGGFEAFVSQQTNQWGGRRVGQRSRGGGGTVVMAPSAPSQFDGLTRVGGGRNPYGGMTRGEMHEAMTQRYARMSDDDRKRWERRANMGDLRSGREAPPPVASPVVQQTGPAASPSSPAPGVTSAGGPVQPGPTGQAAAAPMGQPATTPIPGREPPAPVQPPGGGSDLFGSATAPAAPLIAGAGGGDALPSPVEPPPGAGGLMDAMTRQRTQRAPLPGSPAQPGESPDYGSRTWDRAIDQARDRAGDTMRRRASEIGQVPPRDALSAAGRVARQVPGAEQLEQAGRSVAAGAVRQRAEVMSPPRPQMVNPAAPVAPPVAEPTGMINGRPASEVLAEMRRANPGAVATNDQARDRLRRDSEAHVRQVARSTPGAGPSRMSDPRMQPHPGGWATPASGTRPAGAPARPPVEPPSPEVAAANATRARQQARDDRQRGRSTAQRIGAMPARQPRRQRPRPAPAPVTPAAMAADMRSEGWDI